MQFLTLSRRIEGFADSDFAPLVELEGRHARTLYGEGFIRQIWHRADRPGACILFEADSEGQVRERLNTLPMVKAGMLDVTIIPLKPYGGFQAHDFGRKEPT
jgi:muconolactone delta-isomerase